MKTLAGWCRWLADWLDPPPLLDPLVARAGVLAQAADMTFGPGYGEAKRHAVYARLLKECPQTPKAQIGLAIELAVLKESR